MTTITAGYQLLGPSGARILVAILALLSTLSLACTRGGSKVGRVSGTVTLDGKPLANALVTFDPVTLGSPSHGRTNDSGHYTLTYTPEIQGAEIGDHTVRISSWSPGNPDAKPPDKPIAERVPKKYNTDTELKREVKSGTNTIDFDL